MAVIETRKKLVDEVQLKTNVIVNVLEDVRVNLEMLTEQRAVVDHVVESMARVNATVQSAQATLKSLQTERELAERIERGIKLLRSKTAPVTQTDGGAAAAVGLVTGHERRGWSRGRWWAATRPPPRRAWRGNSRWSSEGRRRGRLWVPIPAGFAPV